MAALAALVFVAAGVAGPADAAGPRVGTAGTSLTLDGRPWWPVGLNAYQLGTDWDVNAGCGAEVDLDGYFSALPPHSLTRFNVYSSMAHNKATGAVDFGPLDAVFAAAARHDQLLIAVLSGHEGGCENDGTKNSAWYAGGWREADPRSPMPFGTWLDTAVARWGDSPALAGWTAVGEPEPSNCGSQDCVWQQRSCPPDSAKVLRTFFDQTGARIRALDPDAVIWSGLAGGGQCGAAGAEFAMISASPGVDVLEYHDYKSGPGMSPDLPERIAAARVVGKPLVVAELGLSAGSCVPTATRANLLNKAIAAQRTAGTAGVLFWSYVPDPRGDRCTYDIGPDDPLIGVVG